MTCLRESSACTDCYDNATKTEDSCPCNDGYYLS